MTLGEFVAERRKAAFEELLAGRPPTDASFDERLFRDAKDHGRPQMGPVEYRPDCIVLDFIYPAERGASTVLAVTVTTPEPIVYMPVPEWVVEQVWQGDVQGSYRFESESRALLKAFEKGLASERQFGPSGKFVRG